LKVKIKKFGKFFIAAGVRVYEKNTVYNFVDFRIKRAGSSNYGGRLFSAGAGSRLAEMQELRIKN